MADVKPGYPVAGNSGFEFDGALPPADAARREVAVVAINRAGTQTTPWPKVADRAGGTHAMAKLYDERGGRMRRPVLRPAGHVRASSIGGAAELDTIYAPYASPTSSSACACPSSTCARPRGPPSDWAFDPDWNVDRRCGERRIADDSLSAVIAHAVAQPASRVVHLERGHLGRRELRRPAVGRQRPSRARRRQLPMERAQRGDGGRLSQEPAGLDGGAGARAVAYVQRLRRAAIATTSGATCRRPGGRSPRSRAGTRSSSSA